MYLLQNDPEASIQNGSWNRRFEKYSLESTVGKRSCKPVPGFCATWLLHRVEGDNLAILEQQRSKHCLHYR